MRPVYRLAAARMAAAPTTASTEATRTKDIGTQDDPIVHRDGHVPINAHPIRYLASLAHGFLLLSSWQEAGDPCDGEAGPTFDGSVCGVGISSAHGQRDSRRKPRPAEATASLV